MLIFKDTNIFFSVNMEQYAWIRRGKNQREAKKKKKKQYIQTDLLDAYISFMLF